MIRLVGCVAACAYLVGVGTMNSADCKQPSSRNKFYYDEKEKRRRKRSHESCINNKKLKSRRLRNTMCRWGSNGLNSW